MAVHSMGSKKRNFFTKAVGDIKEGLKKHEAPQYTWNKRVAEELKKQGYKVDEGNGVYCIDIPEETSDN